MNVQDFLKGDVQDLFTVLNNNTDTASKFSTFYKGSLSPAMRDNLVVSIPEMRYIISKWQSNVGANGSNVVVGDESTLVSARTEQTRNQMKRRIYNFLYTEQDYKTIELQIIELVVKDGSAICLLNDEGKVIVESVDRFEIHWDNQQKRATYDYMVDGVAKVRGMRHGEELYHIKDPVNMYAPVPRSRLEAVYSFVVMRQQGLLANAKNFEGGFINTVAMIPDASDVMNYKRFSDPTQDSTGKTAMDRFLQRMKEAFGGARNSNRGMVALGIKDIKELGSNNQAMQFSELIRYITPEAIAWAYSLVLADFGSGANVTFDNANTFDAALYDKFGRPMEAQLDTMRNAWLLKKVFKFPISERVYIQYVEPQDPNKVAEANQKMLEWNSDALTLNEWREWNNMESIEGGDMTKTAWIAISTPAPEQASLPQDGETVDVKSTVKNSLQFEKKTLHQSNPYSKLSNSTALRAGGKRHLLGNYKTT